MASNSPQWLVTVTEGSSVKIEEEKSGLVGMVSKCRSKVSRFAENVWKIGADDPRKVIHCVKVGLALALVSIFYYTRPLYDGVGGAAMWAIMTVIVIFEFTVGGSLYKGLNRTTATLSAGALACGIHWLASKSLFLFSASAATFSRFILPIKAKFDYGVLIFILTFNFVAVSSYRIDNLLALAQKRLSTIAIGVAICLIVCIIVFPVWAGEDLHLLIIRNMEKLANSLEYSVTEFFRDEHTDADKLSCQTSQGYKSVLTSKASEDSLANLAVWEPPHGPFKLRHPWQQYLKVGAAMRHCAYSIVALNGFIHSEIQNKQAPGSIKKHLSDVCTKLSTEYSQVLKESANSLRTMRKSSMIELMVVEMNDAVEEVHCTLRNLLPSLISVVSLLIEISVKIEGIVDAVEDLADLAGFSAVVDENEEGSKPANNTCSPLLRITNPYHVPIPRTW